MISLNSFHIDDLPMIKHRMGAIQNAIFISFKWNLDNTGVMTVKLENRYTVYFEVTRTAETNYLISQARYNLGSHPVDPVCTGYGRDIADRDRTIIYLIEKFNTAMIGVVDK